MVTVLNFFNQVKAEVLKIVWPARKEVVMGGLMVVLIAVLVSLFLFLVDQVIGFVLGYLLSIGH